MVKKSGIFFLVVILILVTAQMIFHPAEPAEQPTADPENIFANLTSKPKAGSPAPDFSLPDLQDAQIKLSGVKGKAVVLNFWSINCGPCVEEIPLLEQMGGLRPEELVVVAVNLGDPKNSIESFVKSNKITYTVLQDGDGSISNLYHVSAYPVTYFIDRDGIIQAVHTGQLTSGILPANLKEIGITSW
jgi:cytochrome c biogenesis protein CcmG, thiol:disulfide interchange protein DsbE